MRKNVSVSKAYCDDDHLVRKHTIQEGLTSDANDVLRDLTRVCASDMIRLEETLLSHLTHEVELITHITHHLIVNGGKRLRPLLSLACCHAVCGAPSQKMVELAASIELIHNATLLHDDVIDDSTLRRGKPTANALWGNKASILVGDFLFAKAFELMLGENEARVLPILASVSQTITAGEVLQLSYMETFEMEEAVLLNIMTCKTAALFAASTEISAAFYEKGDLTQKALRDFGHNLGMAFQVVDDVLDYIGTTDVLGKKVGDDLAEGKVTLPLYYAYQRATPCDQTYLKEALGQRSDALMKRVVAIMHDTGALRACYDRAAYFSHTAMQALLKIDETSEIKKILLSLPQALIMRIQ